MDWLRLQTIRMEIVLSAAQAGAPLTGFPVVHGRTRNSSKAFLHRRDQLFGRYVGFGLFVLSPAPLSRPLDASRP
jgi:hypothetical protein